MRTGPWPCEFQRVYALVKEQEMDQFDAVISHFEYATYLYWP